MVNLTCICQTHQEQRGFSRYQFQKKDVVSIELFASVSLMAFCFIYQIFAEVLDTSVFMAKGTALPRLGAA